MRLSEVDGYPSPWKLDTRQVEGGSVEYSLEAEEGIATETLHAHQARIVMEGSMLMAGVREEPRQIAALALSEVCANAIDHGGGLLGVNVRTRGTDFEDIVVANPVAPEYAGSVPSGEFSSDHEPDLDALGGRGLFMIAALGGKIEHRYDPGEGVLYTRVHSLGQSALTGAFLP